MKRKRRKQTLIGLLLLALCLRADIVHADMPVTSAFSAALFEVNSCRMVYGDNEHAKAYMASTTKVMTALLAVEHGNLDEPIRIPDMAVGTEGSSIYLARGETMTMRDLLYGLMLVSGNDAAVTIAIHICGSVEAFAELMNARAVEIGCRGTHFANPNGLPDENHYTTAYDLGLIAATAMQNRMFREIVGTTYYQTTSGDTSRTFKNKNKILWQYEGGNGIKTGFTKAAGRCLVFSAERQGTMMVGVVLNAPDMWNDAENLLNYGFASVHNTLLVSAQRPLGMISVEQGEKKSLAVYPKDDILYPLMLDGSDSIDWDLELNELLAAPIQAGTEAGELVLRINGEAVGRMPLIVTEAVAKATAVNYFREIIEWWVA
ncbi:MAG: D-alanyl-D-alanine carboxypeptidase family protein [Clostridia bacterium]